MSVLARTLNSRTVGDSAGTGRTADDSRSLHHGDRPHFWLVVACLFHVKCAVADAI